MSTSTALITVAEFLKLQPPNEGHLELHHGEVVHMPPPKWRHQIVQERIAALLKEQLGKSGVVLGEMAFRAASEFEVWQADVGYVQQDRVSGVDPSEYLRGAPDLVVEVISPGNPADELEDRRCICVANGCKSFWVVIDRLKTITVTEVESYKTFGPGESISSALLADKISTADIFY